MNTNKRRELADSKYNERRAECETAVSEPKKNLISKHLVNWTSGHLMHTATD